MKLRKVLVTLPSSLKPIVDSLMAGRLRDGGCGMSAIYSDTPLSEDRVCEAVADAEAYIVALEEVSARVIEAAKALQVVTKFGIGTDNIDLAAAKRAGVAVTNCPSGNTNAVAEMALCLILSLLRDVQSQCNELRRGVWKATVGSELAGKSVGIIGFGSIGRRVARYLSPFGTTVRVFDVNRDGEAAAQYGVLYTSLDELLRRSDVVTVHVPLTPQTRHLLGAGELARMKRGACIVNLARGGVVDEPALYQAIRSGRVRRAAVDVFEREPPFGSPLLSDERVLVLPHTGGVTEEALRNIAMTSTESVLAVLDGRPVLNTVVSK
ncbi:MAG: phosphoglycerate dehydrogenase [Spirochaetales bacterium]|nr:phosphoglycerate dehydrogenase [Spirochaetales bacterium]